jgi:hypothetical protein
MFAGQTPGEVAGSGDCRWCPLCQAAAVLRGERPEVTAALADILTTASAALRALAEQIAPATDDSPQEPQPPAADEPDVQRIEIA